MDQGAGALCANLYVPDVRPPVKRALLLALWARRKPKLEYVHGSQDGSNNLLPAILHFLHTPSVRSYCLTCGKGS